MNDKSSFLHEVENFVLDYISVGDVFSRSLTFSNNSNYVSWFAAYSYDGWVISVDSRQLVRLHFIFFQNFFLFLWCEKFMFRHEVVVENFKGWKVFGNQFYSVFFGAGLGGVGVLSDGGDDSFFNFCVIHGFLELCNVCDSHCSVGGNSPQNGFFAIFHFEFVADGVLYVFLFEYLVTAKFYENLGFLLYQCFFRTQLFIPQARQVFRGKTVCKPLNFTLFSPFRT